MRTRRFFVASTVVAGLLAAPLLTNSASAQTFAQFNQQAGGNTTTLTNSAAGGTLSGTSIPIVFRFLGATNPNLIGQAINGTLTLTASTNGAARPSGGNVQQDFSAITFTFRASGAQTVNGVSVANNALLLQGTSGNTPDPIFGGPFPGGQLSGQATSGNTPGGPGFTGSDVNPAFPGDLANDVVFTSDFITFTNSPTEGDTYAFGLSNATPNFSLNNNGTVANPGDDYINPFTAAISGTFSANVSAVPEPGAVALLSGLGVTGSIFGFRLRRRR